MDCDGLAEVAAELALGALTGRERAQAIMHLDVCGTCRERIRRPRSHRGGSARAAAGLRAAGRVRDRGDRPAWFHQAAPQTATDAAAVDACRCGRCGRCGRSGRSGRRGDGRGGRLWLCMNVDTGSGNGTLICQLEGRDGRRITVGSFRLTGGYGHWGQAGTPAACRRDRCPADHRRRQGSWPPPASASRDDGPRGRHAGHLAGSRGAKHASAAPALTRPGG